MKMIMRTMIRIRPLFSPLPYPTRRKYEGHFGNRVLICLWPSSFEVCQEQEITSISALDPFFFLPSCSVFGWIDSWSSWVGLYIGIFGTSSAYPSLLRSLFIIGINYIQYCPCKHITRIELDIRANANKPYTPLQRQLVWFYFFNRVKLCTV